MKLRTLIVDDEALARQRLQKLLTAEPDLEIVGECANGPEAIADIRRHQPDLVFLDVHMPQFNGLEVVRALPPEGLPAIVFVTAHDRYAVEAFEVRALDYLLKPFSRARLQEAVRRVRQRLQAPPPTQTSPAAEPARLAESNSPYLNRFAVKNGNQTLFVRTKDVDFIEAASNYAVLCTTNGNHIMRATLHSLEASLPPALFLRISRSIIINLERIKAIRSGLPGEWLVILQDDRELQMTRGFKEAQARLQYAALRSSLDD